MEKLKSIFAKLKDKFISFCKWVWSECKDWRTVVIFAVVVVVMYSPVWGGYICHALFGWSWCSVFATAYLAFWAGPFTPYFPLCIAIALAIKRLFDKKKDSKNKKIDAALADELMKKPFPEIPADIAEMINTSGKITLTGFEDKNDILNDENLQQEVGFSKFSDGSYLVSMVCPMPNITADMIKWWFWWHPQSNERYKIWFPGEHYSVGYGNRNSEYFSAESCPDFQPNTQYPTERIGEIRMPLRIDFVTPEEFGFSQNIMNENNIPIIVCGHVGALRGAVWHTEMAHIFKQTDDGLFLISRFWLGKRLKNKLLRKIILTDKTAKGMAEHCCVEYRNLAQILPVLYEKYSQPQD